MTDWTLDPLERARFLDGEGSLDERAERERHLATDSTARALLEREQRRLAVYRLAAVPKADASTSDLQALTSRVRYALAADREALSMGEGRGSQATTEGAILNLRTARSARWARWSIAAAAVLVGAVTWSGFGRVQESQASDRDVRLAAETFLSAEQGLLPDTTARPGATCDEGVVSPHRFPLVVSGESKVEACMSGQEAGTSVSVLRGDDKAASPSGLVTVPWDGKSSSTDVGYTRVGDLVVFDVAIGRAKYFLATRWTSVAGTPSCGACHGPARSENPGRNPHRFFDRGGLLTK